MIIPCLRCTVNAMHAARERGVLKICAACGYELIDYEKKRVDLQLPLPGMGKEGDD